MIDFLKQNSPPGINSKQQFHLFLFGNIISFIFSFFTFIAKYINARAELFSYTGSMRIRIEGAIMIPFRNLINLHFSGYYLVAVAMLCFIIYHYSYYRQNSMSIYLMKRLPNKWERHKRAITIPLLAAFATMGIFLATILFFYNIYFIATPKACLPYDVLHKIWGSY